MQKNLCSLTVFFEDPFWVGIVQRTDGARLEACKITFGPEPRDGEIYAFVLENWGKLRFSPGVPDDGPGEKKWNPKRMRRAAGANSKGAGLPQRRRRPSSSSGNRQSRTKTDAAKGTGSRAGAPVPAKTAKEKEKTQRNIKKRGGHL